MPPWIGVEPSPLRDILVVARLRPNTRTAQVGPDMRIGRLKSDRLSPLGVFVTRNPDVRILRVGSVEYVHAYILFIGQTAAQIASVTAQVAIMATDTAPTAPDWTAADTTTRTDYDSAPTALLDLGKLYTASTAGTFTMWAKVSDSPETPIIKVGTFTVL